jgi:1-acyl-sn-glycerol-3-phosphate acyltransferase
MQEPIAIIGIGCRFPGGAVTPAAFWRILLNGVDAIREMPPERFDLAHLFDPDPGVPGKMYTRWGGFVDEIEQFDPGFFGFSRREALRIDPQHRMLLEVAWEAMEDAGLPADRLAGSQTGVFVGISTHDYPDFQAQPINRTLIDAHTNSGGAGSIAANRMSYVYDFRGPSFIVDTACSSSLVAVHLACQSLRGGECDLALAGGVQAVLQPELTIGFCKASMISPDGRCKAFAAEANGYVRGEGAGVIVLKPLSRALADGDPIYALVRGSAINEDGRTNGMTVPGLPAQQAVLREAYRRAGVRPGDVPYIEAHGPGTPVGDPIEAEALATVVACDRPAGEVLRIGSVKTNIGHLEAASGIAGLIKAALVVKHRQIPPSLHFRTPNPAIPFEDYRLRVVSTVEAWPSDAPALTGVNSFGFGGANAHVVLEGPPAPSSQRTPLTPTLSPLAGRGSKEKEEPGAAQAHSDAAQPNAALADAMLSRTAQADATPSDTVRSGIGRPIAAPDASDGGSSERAGGTAGPLLVRAELLVTSARSAESLRGLARAYRGLALGADAPRLGELVAAASQRRGHHEHRLAVVGRDLETLADHLDAFLNGEMRADVVSGRAGHGRGPRVAFVFAGMGPQWWGMGRQLLQREAVFREVIERCDQLIRRHAAWSLLDELMADESRSRVAEADFAQPVNFAFQAALLALWRSWGIEPAAVVGHSAGEIAAVYATGALDLDEAVRVAFYRGLLQHRATGKGRMLAAGLGLDALQPLLGPYAGRIAVAAVNSPASVTLSGDADAIAELNGILERQGTFSRVMSVQVPYHSHHMDPIEADLLAALAGLDLHPIGLPIVSEVSGDWANEERFDAEYWWRNIRQPVLFGAAVQRLIADGYDTFLEVSPHPVLGAAVNECLAHAGKTGVCLPSLRRNDDDRGIMLRTLGHLYTRGAAVTWDVALGRPQTHVDLPLYAWNKERVWLDAVPASDAAAAAAAGLVFAANGGVNGGSNGHDTSILGSRVRAVQPHWEVDLASPALDYLQDHRIHGAIVFPGAAYVAMALEAAAAIGGTSTLGLEGVEFRKALFVPDSGALRVQAVYEPGTRSVRIHAENGPNGQPGGWTLHSACRLASGTAALSFGTSTSTGGGAGTGTGSSGSGTSGGSGSGRSDSSSSSSGNSSGGGNGSGSGHGLADLEAIRTRCARAMTHDEFYGEVAQRGFTFGPRFMGIEQLSQGDGEALGYVRLPDAHAVEVNGGRVHPALFDAGLQVLIGAVMSREQPHEGRWPAFLPTRAARVTSYRPVGAAFWSHATVQKATPEGFEGTVSIHDDAGNLLLQVEGLCAKTLEDVRAGSRAASSADVLYRLTWEESRPLAGEMTRWCAPAVVAETVNRDADRLSRDLGFAGYYADVEPALERITRAFFARALADLGVTRDVSSPLATDTLPDGTPLHGPRRRLFEAVVAAAASDPELLESATVGVAGGGSAADASASTDARAEDPLALIAALRRARPTYSSVLDVIERCGLALADILSGKRGAPEVLFSGDGLDVMATFYRDAPSCRLFNALTAESVAAAIAGFPAGRGLRVLEIGAGTGAATRNVLPRLPQSRTTFTFTDISPLFLNLARADLGEPAFMRYALLDIERDASAQGFEPSSFDLIIVANVVHATSDVAQTLARIRSLLAPGGVLVLQEITRRPRWLDLVFGITDGWWAFADTTLRPTHALLDVPAWQRALHDAGFEDAAAVHENEDPVPGQSVLVARAPDAAPVAQSAAKSAEKQASASVSDGHAARSASNAVEAAAPVGGGGGGERWLVLADRHGVGERVSAALGRHGRSCVLAFAQVQADGHAPALRRRGESAYEVALAAPDAMRQLVQAAESGHGPIAGVMHLWSLDMPASTAGTSGAAMLAMQSLGYASMLDLLHALQADSSPSPAQQRLSRVVLVTGEAQAIDEMKAITAVAQAPLWGFGRILLHEQPELRPLLVDCSAAPVDDVGTVANASDAAAGTVARANTVPRANADANAEVEAEAIALEAIAAEREDEVALRGTRRYVRRLVRIDLDADAQTQAARPAVREPARGRPFRVEVGATGSMDTLVLREIARPRLAPDEVEIAVKAASLNFRDVVFAMGMLPAEAFQNSMSAGAMGVDHAGVVTAVGDAITDLRPGDEVMALAPASLASHAYTRDLVVRKPAGLSFAEAAALPLAYVTAIYALEMIARIRRGDRVLIHAATGGVGLAAIAVAERAGAEIFATAGTEAKRELLRSRGIRHVMDSRSLDFATQVMEATAGRGVDIVLNSLAGEAIAKGLSVLAPRGRFLEIGKADIYRNNDLPLEAFRRNLSFVAIQVDTLCDTDRDVLREALEATRRGIEDGSLPRLPTQTFPLAQLEDALRTMSQARHVGKLVITFDAEEIEQIEIEPRAEGDAAAGAGADGTPLFRPEATYLITGGRGGVGVALARWAAGRGARRLALMSRSASADDGADHIVALRAQGVEVLLIDGDVSQPSDVSRVVDACGERLKGIFHGAMVIDDAPLSELDRERFERVMAPKAAGAWNLHLATRERGLALDHFVMFSSITSVYGNARQGNYAAANAFLDALAGHRRAQGLPGLTVNWGVFSDAGYVATRKELGEYLARQGQYGLSAEDGFNAMAAVMARGAVQATIARTDWPVWAEANPVMGASPRFRALVKARGTTETSKSQTTGAAASRILDTLLAHDVSTRRPEVQQHLRRRVAKILGTGPDRIESSVPLTDMGMDSLMAVELMTMLKNDVAIDMPAVKLLQGVTIDRLTDAVFDHLLTLSPSPVRTAEATGTPTFEAIAQLASPPSPLTEAAVAPPASADHQSAAASFATRSEVSQLLAQPSTAAALAAEPASASAPVSHTAQRTAATTSPGMAASHAVSTPASQPPSAGVRLSGADRHSGAASAAGVERGADAAAVSGGAEDRAGTAAPVVARPLGSGAGVAADYGRWTPFQRFARVVVTGAVRGVADVRVEGLGLVPATGPVVIAANHVSMWDAPVLLRIAERRTVMFAAEELRRNVWVHWTLHKIWDAIYLKRGEGDTEALEQALAVLRGGGMLGLGPEGHRSRGGLRRGLTGVAHLAYRSGAPILPVAISGQEHIPTAARRFRRAPVQVRIGEPIPAPHGEPSAQALRAYTDRVMVAIARMLPPSYRGFYASAVDKLEAEEAARREIA